MTRSVWARYGAYLEKPPTHVLEWHDTATPARGWLVLNSLHGGAAGGGTRMRRGLGREEVTYLAKAMELKFAFSGPPIGGGKSGIDFDPEDPRREDVLRRWYAAVRPFLVSCYGTGGDVNVDEQRDVVPLCAELGIIHPQEGIVRGHLGLTGDAVQGAFRRLHQGLQQQAGPYGVDGVALYVSDLITGWGVARATARLHERRGEPIEGARVIVEGFGNVGAAAALYLARMGARIVGIVDVEHGLRSAQGLGAEEVEDLLRRRTDRTIPDHPSRSSGEGRDSAYAVEADVFVPAAISGSVGTSRLAQLARQGVRRIVCGANQPIREQRLGETHTSQSADGSFEVLPDVVASLGAARAFFTLMAGDEPQTAGRIFEDVGRAINDGVDAVVDRVGSARCGLIASALEIAMERRA